MEELYVEGVATRGDPEPCVGVREGTGEASGWARAGRAIEPRNVNSGVPTLSEWRKATSAAAISQGAVGPRVVKEPGHVRNLHVREPGDPAPAHPCDQRAGRPGNAEAVILG